MTTSTTPLTYPYPDLASLVLARYYLAHLDSTREQDAGRDYLNFGRRASA